MIIVVPIKIKLTWINNIPKLIFLRFLAFTCAQCTKQKSISVTLSSDIVNPKTYVVYKTSKDIILDGKEEEQD